MNIDVPDQLANLQDSRYGCVVSFDFDDTLTLPAFNPATDSWEHSLEPNYFILAEMMRLAALGYSTIIITERGSTEYNKERIHQFVLLYDLPVISIVYTGGEDKATFAVAAGAQMHYDDDKYEIFQLAEYDITGVLVPHPSDYFTADDYRQAVDSWKMKNSALKSPTESTSGKQ